MQMLFSQQKAVFGSSDVKDTFMEVTDHYTQKVCSQQSQVTSNKDICKDVLNKDHVVATKPKKKFKLAADLGFPF